MNTKTIGKGMMATLLSLMMMVSFVAGMLPMNVNGRITINGIGVETDVTITNLDSGDSRTIRTNGAGEFIFSLYNLPNDVRGGDIIEVSVLDQKRTQAWNSQTYDILTYYIDIIRDDCPACPGCPPSDPCPDCVVDCPDIPECPVVDDCPDPIVCDVCEICEEPTPEQCADNLWQIIAAASVATAVTVTITAKGIKHVHRGIRNKHSVLTRHRDARIRHKIGEVAPKYEKINGEWTYVPKEER